MKQLKQQLIGYGLILCYGLLGVNAQEGPKPVTTTQAVQTLVEDVNLTTNGETVTEDINFVFQVGVPFRGNTNTMVTDTLSVRFPWDVLYLTNTFGELPSQFSVSKGFFGDRIELNWQVLNNQNLITGFQISRRVFNGDRNSDTPFTFVANVSATTSNYEDFSIEGGILYEYQIVARGVPPIGNISNLQNSIRGIGYRNPTAIVTGNITFEGGTPVQGVRVCAEPEGAQLAFGSSLSIVKDTIQTLVFSETKNLTSDDISLQAWVKPHSGQSGTLKIFDIHKRTTPDDQGNFTRTAIDIITVQKPNDSTMVVDIGSSKFTLVNRYPDGTIDSRGNIGLANVEDVFNNFVQYSVVIRNSMEPRLFINGVEIDDELQDEVNEFIRETNRFNSENPPEEGEAFVLQKEIRITLALSNTDFSVAENEDINVEIGGGMAMYMDELRLWKRALDTSAIATNYLRYISGNDADLVGYYRFDEGVGRKAYDLSRTGFTYNEHHLSLAADVSFTTETEERPTSAQFGVLGVTDDNGNYEISSIPYSGNGESFRISPKFGMHEFDPNQQLIFLGTDAPIANRIDFTDISSFEFRGRVLYDTRGVFPAFSFEDDPMQDPNPIDEVRFQLTDTGYNTYIVNDNGTQLTLPKGEFWLPSGIDEATPPQEPVVFERYGRIGLEGANIFIDGQIVLDGQNRPLETDDEGNFVIEVPIGEHYIEVRKQNHTLLHNGRFPAIDQGNGLFNFFEDRTTPVQFVDTTRVSVVGKVVGGSVEAAKPIGFGQDGLRTVMVTDSLGNTSALEASAKNNLGVATIIFGHQPPSGDIQPETTATIKTNVDSGEYRAHLLPLRYQIEGINGVRIDFDIEDRDNPDTPLREIIENSEDLNFEEVRDSMLLKTPEFRYEDFRDNEIVQDTLKGAPYHYEKSFVLRNDPEIEVLEQTSEESIEIVENPGQDDEETFEFSTAGITVPDGSGGTTPVNVYKQFAEYSMQLQSFERYINRDTGEAVEDLVPVIDGELNITNNLALVDSGSTEIDSLDASIRTYTFRAGLPNISAPFTRSISANLRIGEIDYVVSGDVFVPDGIIIGGASDGSQTFITAGPDVPDIILRDPPGSNSFASIEEGQTFSFSKSVTAGVELSASANGTINVGAEFGVGGGVTGPIVEQKIQNSVEVGISTTMSASSGQSTQTTYSFSQTISTSSDPDFVGSAGDLYIGQSKNYFYGTFNEIRPTRSNTDFDVSLLMTNSNNESFHIVLGRGISFVEEPSDTFFVFSQNHILNTLIPELEVIIREIESGELNPDDPEVQPKAFYEEQIRLWRYVIRENERSKYRAIHNRDELLNAAKSGDGPFSDDFIDDNFQDNVSFDAGVGSFDRSISSGLNQTIPISVNLQVEESVALTTGATVGGAGFKLDLKATATQNINTDIEIGEENSTTITYTLQDNDLGNFISVDIINAFDGNGPIFSTQGGRTSCPHEGKELSVLYNHQDYLENPNPDVIETLLDDDGDLRDPEVKQEQLSFATQPVEVPMITVAQASVTGIPESSRAEFRLFLENNTVGETGADSDFLLLVDNTTNPDNAIFNLEANGTIVHVPEGQRTEFLLTMQKGASDVFDYEDIVIRLESLCDEEDVSSEVIVSATFIPVCTEVNLVAPLDNWVFNRNTASINDNDEIVNDVNIRFNGFDINASTFSHINLEYRLATAPNWTRIQTYHLDTRTPQEKEDEVPIPLPEGISDKTTVINRNQEISFNWDIVGLGLQDGAYEVRAVSYCTDDTEFISNIATGTIDLSAPRRFGTPQPIDGILEAGEDLRVSFNEDIFYNSALSRIEITGATNQLPVNNNVSLRFPGNTGTDNVIIENPNIQDNDLSIEFWMKDDTVTPTSLEELPAVILQQDNGIEIGINQSRELYFTLGGQTVSGIYNTIDDLFHHYTFTYSQDQRIIAIYEDDQVIVTQTFDDPDINPNGTIVGSITNNNDFIIGAANSSFVGNIHDFRLWGDYITLSNAVANQFTQLNGNEAGLLGYWSMHEGNGDITQDLARANHAVVNTNWDIFPRGTAYAFEDEAFLAFEDVGTVLITKEMEATISFWVRANAGEGGTLFSNGRGNGEDVDQTDGDNKWAITLNTDGSLEFNSEGNVYELSVNQNLNDGQWHHVALLFNRLGALRTYVDANLVSSNPIQNVGGFSGNRFWLGVRGFVNAAQQETFDQHFTGEIDEFRIWNSLRSVEQIDRDRFNEVDANTLGLIFNARLNEPDQFSSNRNPEYSKRLSTGDVIFDRAVPLRVQVNNGNATTVSISPNYSDNVPPIRPARNIENFSVSHVINEDVMILEPLLASEALIEGQILDITVDRMFDAAGNRQLSPITWTAFYQRNPVRWFANGFVSNTVNINQTLGDERSFTITLMNSGGNGQPFDISNVPAWLDLSQTSGTLEPNSSIEITANIDPELSVGEYLETISLTTDFGFDQKLILDIRVLANEPDWSVDPTQFDFSMNIIGKISVDGVLSEDLYDNVAAFVGDELRGVVDLIFDEDFQEYFAFLTVYSNQSFGENVTFKIWDASRGQILQARLNGSISAPFANNQVIGTLGNTAIFENTGIVQQEIDFNSGWTWISLNVNDPNFNDLNTLTSDMSLRTGDRILSHSPARTDIYEENALNPSLNGWAGTISANGGLNSSKMYRVRLSEAQRLTLSGQSVVLEEFSFPIQENWNWLPYPIARNVLVNEALSTFSAAEGDIIKSQNRFAIFDPTLGWRGTLTSLETGQGYLIRATQAQDFSYPLSLDVATNREDFNAGANNANSEQEKQYVFTDLDYTQFANNMNAIVQVPKGYDTLYAFDTNGDLRGASHINDVADLNLHFMSLFGEADEALTFHLGNTEGIFETKFEINFKADTLIGTINQPYVISLEDIKKESRSDIDFEVYPNPFGDEFKILVFAKEQKQIQIQLYDITGKRVYDNLQTLEAGNNILEIRPNLDANSGTYFLKTRVDTKDINIKLIKQ